MKTSKLFSTISYNTVPYLTAQLNGLVERGVLYWYTFVYHFKEEDERKDHIHLLMLPNGSVDTDKVLKLLEEYDPSNPTLPLRCRPPHKTNVFGDWYLYNKHDPKYLKAHGQQERKYQYRREDFVTSDDDELDDLIHQIDYSKMYGNLTFLEELDKGKSVVQLVREGIVPIQQYGQHAKFAYDMVDQALGRTFRGDRATHTPLYDPTTGEIMEQTVIDKLQPTDEEDPF